MTWKRSTRRSFCLLVTVLLVSCATPATRSDLTPTFSGLTSSHITIGVVDSRPYVISGNKEPWFEGIMRGGFGIPYTFNRPDRPPNETFADRIAKMLERTFTDAGSQVTVVRLARGSTQPAARGKLKPQTKDVALLIRIHDSKFDAGGFSFDYPYHFQLSVLDPEGNTLAQASVQGRDAHTPSSKYNVWDMYGVVYRDKLEQLLVKPEIQLAIASPTRTVPVEKHTVSVEQAETETVGKNTDSVSEATAITSGLLAQSEQETQRREQYAKADGKAVAETLAALKLLHDQGVLSDKDYMQKQREIINEHTRKTQASLAGDEPLTTSGSGSPQKASPSGATAVATVTVAAVKDESESELSESTRGTRSIGILPIKLSSSSHGTYLAVEFEAGRELQTLLAKAVDIKVEYSAYDGNSTASLDTETLWEAQLFHPNVREKQLRQLGVRLGVDYVVTAWLGTGGHSVSEDIIPWPLDLYVLRVRDGELRAFKTNNKSLGPVVQELIAFIRL